MYTAVSLNIKRRSWKSTIEKSTGLYPVTIEAYIYNLFTKVIAAGRYLPFFLLNAKANSSMRSVA